MGEILNTWEHTSSESLSHKVTTSCCVCVYICVCVFVFVFVFALRRGSWRAPKHLGAAGDFVSQGHDILLI